jgi:predicted Zn-dependent protease
VLVLAPVPYALAAVARVQVWQDPIRLWSEALVETPHSTRARTNLARELGLRKRFAEALAVIDPAVRSKPDEIGPRLNRAAARLSLGDARGAVEDYQHATRLAPDWIDPWQGLARAAAAAGDRALAEQARQRCEELGGE